MTGGNSPASTPCQKALSGETGGESLSVRSSMGQSYADEPGPIGESTMMLFQKSDGMFVKPRYLGWMNGWEKVPDEVAECWKLGHIPDRERRLSGYERVSCRRCHYYYDVDSSD